MIGRVLSWFRRVGRRGVRAAFAAAVSSRLTAEWIFAPFTSADQEIRGELRSLIRRSRELARNNPHARRFLQLSAENIVGPKGITLQARVQDAAGNQDAATNRMLEAAWADWARPGVCTPDRRYGFKDVLWGMVLAERREGEALLRILPGWRGNRYRFAVQPLDTDLLDIEYNVPPGRGQNEIRMGVEIDAFEAPVAYWLWTNHPSDTSRTDRERVRVPADEIIHYYDPMRPGQTRGYPKMAAVMLTVRHRLAYLEAEIMAARLGASKSVWFKLDPDVYPDPDQSMEGFTLEAKPGVHEALPPGVEAQTWDPTHPTTAFEAFDRSMLRTVATGLDVSYASLTGDLENVNYSSIRAGMVAERAVWEREQDRLVDHVCRRVYLEWMRWAMTAGAIQDARRFVELAAHEWQPRGWDWVDPYKDAQGKALEIKMGLTSRKRIAARRGVDVETVFNELSDEAALADDLDINVDGGTDGQRPYNETEDEDGARGWVFTNGTDHAIPGNGHPVGHGPGGGRF